jgi:hypothetical protein
MGNFVDFKPSVQLRGPREERPNPPWTSEKELLLVRLFKRGLSFFDLADNLREYNIPAIRAKLKELGYMKSAYGDTRDNRFREPWTPGDPLPYDIDSVKLSEKTLLPRRKKCSKPEIKSAA